MRVRAICMTASLGFVACGDAPAAPDEGTGGASSSAATSALAVSSGGDGGGAVPTRCSVDDGSPEHIVSIAVGGRTSLALSSHGRVACWGDNNYGGCGRGSSSSLVYDPVWLPGLACIKQIDIDFTGLALNDAGEGLAWGTEFGGELGDGEGTSGEYAAPVSVLLPRPASFLHSDGNGGKALVEGQTWMWGYVFGAGDLETPQLWDLPEGAEAYGGGGNVCTIDAAGLARCMGTNTFGAVGDGTLERRDELVDVATDARLASLHYGLTFACAISLEREVFCWGDNDSAQLGIGTLPPLGDPIEDRAVPTPTLLPGLTGVASIDLAEAGGCALDSVGDVYCWGENILNRFVPRDGDDHLLTPRRLDDLSPARAVAVGDHHVCVLRDDATVWCRGSGVMRGFYENTPEEASPMQFFGGDET